MDIESIPVPAPLPPSLTTARYEKPSPSESLVLLSWTCERLADLSPLALYQALALRAEVFVVEQQCIYLDPDGVDLLAWHLLGHDGDDKLVAVARLLPPLAKGPAHRFPEIGRVLCALGARGGGRGRALMLQALLHCERLWPGQPVALSAQAYLLNFYASLGFAPLPDTEPYLEDGILHIDMRKGTAT